MKITGKLTGKDASQARAAILPPPSMENVTFTEWAQPPRDKSNWGAKPKPPPQQGAGLPSVARESDADWFAPLRRAEEEWAEPQYAAHLRKPTPARGQLYRPTGATRSTHKAREI